MSKSDDQQFCLRWNNFQANITSQFEHLRDEEDFTDVTIACEGQQIQAHKIVLSACSPFFKEIFKSNPCRHPIVFMRDVEAQHIVALMEFMYAGEVNVAQAELSTFLKTAESLKIRGLTDTSSNPNLPDEQNRQSLKAQSSKAHSSSSPVPQDAKSNSTQLRASSTAGVTCAQDFPSSPDSLPSSKKSNNTLTNNDTNLNSTNTASCQPIVASNLDNETSDVINSFLSRNSDVDPIDIRPKMEIPDASDEEIRDGEAFDCNIEDITEFAGGMEIIAQPISNPLSVKNDSSTDIFSSTGRLRAKQQMFKNDLDGSARFSRTNFQNNFIQTKPVRSYRERGRSNNLVKLGEGIEIYEDQLRTVKWSDYRKLTRGLATILFSPTELATCSVTGQRWSRAGNGERPVKPALDRTKVQAIISYVSMRFPSVEISRIKQVLAYKCKENSTAFKMKAVRYYGKNERGNAN